MVIPFRKKNGKFSLYNTDLDFKSDNKQYSVFGDNTNYSELYSDEFDFIHPFVEGFAIANKGYNLFYLGIDGEILVTDHEYHTLKNFVNGIAAVSRESHQGYRLYHFINKNGKEIIDKSYNEYTQYPHKSYIEVLKYTGYYVDSSIDPWDVSPTSFSEMRLDYSGYEQEIPEDKLSIHIQENLCEVPTYYRGFKFNKKHCYLDIYGNRIDLDKIRPFEYIDGFYFNRSIAVLKNTKDYVIIDTSLKIIKVLGKYPQIELGGDYDIPESDRLFFSQGLNPMKQNGKWGFIDIDGEFVLKPKYDFLMNFVDSKSWTYKSKGCTVAGKYISKQMKYTALDSDFNELTDFSYDEMGIFYENVASVRVNNKWGAINSCGEIIIPIEYNFISRCQNGFICVGLGDYESKYEFVGHYGCYNQKGEKLSKVIYENHLWFEFGICIIKKRGKFGLLNSNGQEIVKCKYDDMEGDPKSGYIVEFDGYQFYIDITGREFRFKE